MKTPSPDGTRSRRSAYVRDPRLKQKATGNQRSRGALGPIYNSHREEVHVLPAARDHALSQVQAPAHSALKAVHDKPSLLAWAWTCHLTLGFGRHINAVRAWSRNALSEVSFQNLTLGRTWDATSDKNFKFSGFFNLGHGTPWQRHGVRGSCVHQSAHPCPKRRVGIAPGLPCKYTLFHETTETRDQRDDPRNEHSFQTRRADRFDDVTRIRNAISERSNMAGVWHERKNTCNRGETEPSRGICPRHLGFSEFSPWRELVLLQRCRTLMPDLQCHDELVPTVRHDFPVRPFPPPKLVQCLQYHDNFLLTSVAWLLENPRLAKLNVSSTARTFETVQVAQGRGSGGRNESHPNIRLERFRENPVEDRIQDGRTGNRSRALPHARRGQGQGRSSLPGRLLARLRGARPEAFAPSGAETRGFAGLTGGLSELRRDVQGVLTSGLCDLCGLERETSSARREIQLLQPYGWYKGPHKGPSTPPALSFGNDERERESNFHAPLAKGPQRRICRIARQPFHRRTRFDYRRRHASGFALGKLRNWRADLSPSIPVSLVAVFRHCSSSHRLIPTDNSPPTKANRVRSPAGSLPDFLMWDSRQTMPLVGGFSRGSPFPPPLHSGAAPFSPRFTLIGSQDFDVKSLSNLSTPLAPVKANPRQPSWIYRFFAKASISEGHRNLMASLKSLIQQACKNHDTSRSIRFERNRKRNRKWKSERQKKEKKTEEGERKKEE
ncbi:hypothetical protein PR048_007154 [Dryococelus australis]|uniref:Uncharacterized protein n=1 Tax=Dryococelus australis TaxID=614101 RepID=A0ABQ9ICT6_9NEOP|nr:hypothetical protein PR048_007154 [Dryococelus australis]